MFEFFLTSHDTRQELCFYFRRWLRTVGTGLFVPDVSRRTSKKDAIKIMFSLFLDVCNTTSGITVCLDVISSDTDLCIGNLLIFYSDSINVLVFMSIYR